MQTRIFIAEASLINFGLSSDVKPASINWRTSTQQSGTGRPGRRASRKPSSREMGRNQQLQMISFPAMPDLDFNSRVRLEIYQQFLEKGSCPRKKDVAEA